ncbi:YbhB/YbcL family Raf kinase inhibitor-like protein [Snodgrassella sp. CFCC 13594]|uniref:YbhB/YbcL family Raf kinase inhibitor-like protein n=1 Tax=Snodgrassella sp. CFCC 13594 TaxID=1775559 RepID=UPI00082CFAFD|nr:YbhB/YbcL family Raf kinase inhibitor-like protein [Snodgrassella sp. CFCC 13594]
MPDSTFTLTSTEFTEGTKLDASYQADHDNQSPALAWQHPPQGTQSFAIAMHDPDAPTGGAGWWHWLAINIPAHATALARNAGAADGCGMPAGVRQLRNDGGSLGYMGCYPPIGDPAHRYIFTLYALDLPKLDLADNATTSMAGFMVNAHCLGKASLTAYYAR